VTGRETAPGPAEERAAQVTLADLALRLSGGDPERAAVMLRPVLEAVGAVPYERAPGKYRFGAAVP
jgi:hypothetical protein